MGRSVSTPCNARAVVFAEILDYGYDPETEEYDDFISQIEWEDMIINLREHLELAFKSLYPCDAWLGNEDHAIMENGLAYVGVSEYCGCLSVWIVPKDDDDIANLAGHWCARAQKTLESIVQNVVGNRLRLIGRFSNGEAVFERAA